MSKNPRGALARLAMQHAQRREHETEKTAALRDKNAEIARRCADAGCMDLASTWIRAGTDMKVVDAELARLHGVRVAFAEARERNAAIDVTMARRWFDEGVTADIARDRLAGLEATARPTLAAGDHRSADGWDKVYADLAAEEGAEINGDAQVGWDKAIAAVTRRNG